jgi:hypothetical protein
MTAIDGNGLTTKVFRDIQPRSGKVDIQTEPDGLEVVVYDYVVLAPQEIVTWVNHGLLLSVQDQHPFVFQEWGNGDTSKSMNVTLLSNDEKPLIVARFCLERNSTCGKTWICCSGECNESGKCADAPPTGPSIVTGTPTDAHTGIPDEVDVDNTFSQEPTLPRGNDTVGNNSVDDQNSTGITLQNARDDDGLGTSEMWLLSLLTFVVIMFPCCMGLFYCRRGRRRGTELANRSLDDSENSEEDKAPVTLVSSEKESSSVTSAICEKLSEENQRRSKLRAKLDIANFASAYETGTPETVAADTPTSAESTSPGLSISIDETLVRLDDILSRTFQFSRSRRREMSTPEKLDADGVTERATVGPLGMDVEGSYLNSFSHFLLPLGDSTAPDSPLREDPTNSFAVDTIGYSFVSSGLEDGLNDSAVHISDTHSVNSGSGRLLCQEPTVLASLLDASGADSAAEIDFFPESTANADTQMNLDSLRGDVAVAIQDEGDCPYTVTALGLELSLPRGKLEPPPFFDVDVGEESPSCNEDDYSDEEDKDESHQVEDTSFYSGDSVGHSLV